jgi:hypothetical protein
MNMPAEQPLLIALDLDGTIFDGSLVISQRVRDAVRAAAALGVPSTIVTGRMFVATKPHALTLGISGPVVCYQGAAVFDIETGAKLFERSLPNAVAMRVVQRARADGRHAQLYADDKFYVEQRNEHSELYARLAGVEPVVVSSFEEAFAGRDLTKANVVTSAEDAKTYIDAVREAAGTEAYVTGSVPEFVEVMDGGVDKGKALAFVAERLGVPMDRVLAVGDSYNDLPFLRAAGFGVAMGSAPDALKNEADAVVGDVAHHGVAEAIERFVLARTGP